MVPAIGRQVELALHDAGATGGVDDPARRERRLLVELLEASPVRIAAELDLPHARALLQVDAERRARAASLFSNRPRSSWKLSCGGKSRRPDLDPLGDVLVAVRGREVAQPALEQLFGEQVVVHPDDLGEVVGAAGTVDSPTLNAASGAGPSRFSSTTTLVCGRVCLSWIASVRPARPPPRIATS